MRLKGFRVRGWRRGFWGLGVEGFGGLRGLGFRVSKGGPRAYSTGLS